MTDTPVFDKLGASESKTQFGVKASGAEDLCVWNLDPAKSYVWTIDTLAAFHTNLLFILCAFHVEPSSTFGALDDKLSAGAPRMVKSSLVLIIPVLFRVMRIRAWLVAAEGTVQLN